ncbi:MAG: sulfatase, partial [bacterium]|nr:sulfatase [bacterium]
MKSFLYLCILLSLLLTGAACGPTGEPDAIFLITLDTTRADHFNYSLSDNTLTPNFARLAARGQYFENAYALTPITLPSHASIFYSLPPHQLKIYNNGQVQKVRHPSVTQLLKGKGYHTGAVVSLGVLKADFGLHRGFRHYVENFNPYSWIKKAGAVNRDAGELIEKIETDKKDGEKSFYWVHYSDPHEPYFPPCDDGDFSLTAAGKKLFTCPSTELAAVKADLELPPGKHTLVLDTGIPSAFKNFSDCNVEYVKYREFSVTPHEGNDGLEITFPADWTHKKNDQGIDYYSSRLHSEITLRNKRKKPLTVEIRFHYSMHVNDAARKVFYREEIKYMDRKFGEFIAFLKDRGIYERSAFIVIGDHGEGLGEYREHFGHIHFLNKVFTHVPLILAGPGITPQGRRSEPVSTLNIAPTILDLARTEKPAFMLGHSLLKPLPAKAKKKILLETYSPEAFFDAFSLIDYPWQIVFYPGRQKEKLEFFNLQTDPMGTVNLNNFNNITPETNTGEIKKIKTQLINAVLKIS